jgi:hypothetical protein
MILVKTVILRWGCYNDARWLKWPRAEAKPKIGPSSQSGLSLVPSDLQGMSVALVVMGIAHLLGVL